MAKYRLQHARWQVIACLMGLLAFVSIPAQAAPTPVRLMLQWTHQAQFAGYYVALEKGFYNELGLDVTISPGGPGLDASDFF